MDILLTKALQKKGGGGEGRLMVHVHCTFFNVSCHCIKVQ